MQYVCQYRNYVNLMKYGCKLYRVVLNSEFFVTLMFKKLKKMPEI
jgi:hypothetical protein